jgi:hypothetical protein
MSCKTEKILFRAKPNPPEMLTRIVVRWRYAKCGDRSATYGPTEGRWVVSGSNAATRAQSIAQTVAQTLTNRSETRVGSVDVTVIEEESKAPFTSPSLQELKDSMVAGQELNEKDFETLSTADLKALLNAFPPEDGFDRAVWSQEKVNRSAWKNGLRHFIAEREYAGA